MERLAGHISGAVTMRGLYPANHPRVREAIDQVVASARSATSQTQGGAVTFLVVGDDLVIDDEVVRKMSLSVHTFIGILKRHGIERLTLAQTLDTEEATSFIEGLAEGGAALRSTPNIILGRAQLVIDEKPKPEDALRQLSSHQLEIVGEAWARFRVERRLPIDQLEELVWSFIDSVGNTTRAMLPLAKLKAHDEYTFVHSINVSLLVLAQARSFGIWGPMLHTFGMAGLLHDIGMLTVPVDLLHKAGKLNDAEWTVMKSHALEGAWHLAEMTGTPALSVIVAFEHHLRFDGRPNYPLLRATRMPALASRMTAIADTFDAVSTVRPHQQAFSRGAAFEVLKRRSGTFYDPGLVENFIRVVGDAPAGSIQGDARQPSP